MFSFPGRVRIQEDRDVSEPPETKTNTAHIKGRGATSEALIIFSQGSHAYEMQTWWASCIQCQPHRQAGFPTNSQPKIESFHFAEINMFFVVFIAAMAFKWFVGGKKAPFKYPESSAFSLATNKTVAIVINVACLLPCPLVFHVLYYCPFLDRVL